jgi:succinate dehydrogenase / fumarate reductase cytochrome b subunit
VEGRAERRGRWLREVWASTLGKKVIVAITGVFLALYVVAHALGNLKAFEGTGSGQPPLDHYAEWLRDVGDPVLPHNGALWTVRTLLVVALVLHVVAIVQLERRNRAARPAGHRYPPRIRRTFSSRTMLATGVLLLAFSVFPRRQFTTRTIQVTPVAPGEVYANTARAFAKWYFVLLYVAAVAALGLHLRHALWSIWQTAGWDKPNRNPTFRRFATTVALGVALGFAAVPIGFWLDVLPEPGGREGLASLGGDR